MKARLLLAVGIFVVILSSSASAGGFWDECNNPSGGTIYPPGSATEWIAGWLDGEDWASVRINSSGKYTFSLSGPSNANFDLEVYSSCSGSYVCKSARSTSSESCVLYVAGGSTYHMRAITRGWYDSGNWTMSVSANSCSNKCASDYWKECYNVGTLCCSGDPTFGQYYCDSGPDWRKCTSSSHTACEKRGSYYCTYQNGEWRWRDCPSGCSGNSCATCSSHSYSSCYDNDRYWYTSCGGREDKREECGSNYCNSWGSNYCSSGDVYKQRTCYDKGCSSNSCTSSSRTETQLVQDCIGSQTCSNGQCVSITCYSNSDCGTSGYVGSNYCSNNDVYKDYKTYTCNNPGTTSASCSSSTSATKQTECGDTTYGSWGSNYCSQDYIKRSRTAYNKGCSSGACYSNTSTEAEVVENCNNRNYYGSWNYYCSGDSVRKKHLYYDYTCSSASCSVEATSYADDQLVENCSYGCSSGACVTGKPNLTVSSGDITIEG